MTRCDYCGQPEHRPYMQAAPMEYRPPGLFHALIAAVILLLHVVLAGGLIGVIVLSLLFIVGELA
jgi:hypothetical protein